MGNETVIQTLERFHSMMKNVPKETLELSMSDVHFKGLFSLVISGREFGNLTRVFISKNEINPLDVQIHTHRYPIRLTTLTNGIRHHECYVSDDPETTATPVRSQLFDYKSPLNGGHGLSYQRDCFVSIHDYLLPSGCVVEMTSEEFHTVSCSPESIWVVEELGFNTESSKVIGSPFVLDGLYNDPKPFQINDNHQKAIRVIKKLILDCKMC